MRENLSVYQMRDQITQHVSTGKIYRIKTVYKMSVIKLVVFIISVYLCYSSEISEILISLDTTLHDLLLSPEPDKVDQLLQSVSTFSENMDKLKTLTIAKDNSIQKCAKKILNYKELEPFFFQFFDLADTQSDYNLTVEQSRAIETDVAKSYNDWTEFLAFHNLKENENTTFIADNNATSVLYVPIK